MKISASLMCANLLDIKQTLDILEEENIDYIHYDIMDGVFVNNICLGFGLFNQIRHYSKLKMDVHFLARDAKNYLSQLELKKGDQVSVHVESDCDIVGLSREIRGMGIKFGIVINVDTPPEILVPYLPHIDNLIVMLIKPGYAGAPLENNALIHLKEVADHLKKYPNITLEVDGHVNDRILKELIDCGVTILVAGTASIFKSDGDLKNNIDQFRTKIERCGKDEQY